MADSPHQPTSLADEITALKAELTRKEQLLAQIETIGQSNSGGGTSVTYRDPKALEARIDWLRALIKAKVDQLNGDTDNLQPGVNSASYSGDYE